MFSRRTPPPHSSSPFSRALDARRASGAALLDLTESNPTRCGFTYDTAAFARALAAGAEAPYEPHPQGMRAARDAVAASYAERGLAVDPECLVLTSGTSEAYAHLFTLLADADDEILVPTPGYPLLEVLTGLGSVRLVQYRQLYDERRGWRIDLERLEAGISTKSRAVVVVSPNNPTGAFLKHAELTAVSGLCREHGLALIVDEVFTDFGSGRDPARVASAAGHDRVLTFVLNGLSKMSGLPQMKLAWIHASGPRDLRTAAVERLAYIADAYLSVGTPVQHAASVLLGARRTVAPQIRQRVEANFETLEGLAAGSEGTCRVLQREGGWYGVVQLPDDRSDEEAALVLLERDGVLAHPGYFYDFPPAGAFLVLSLLPDPAVFREGAGRLVERIRGWTRATG
jgi:alanine-synthesizing transaminase